MNEGEHRDSPKLYGTLSDWFHLLTPPEEYAEEAAFYSRILVEAATPPPRTLLELGSGGGNNASHMKARFHLTLSDRSPQMLAMSRSLNPECEHLLGDMRELRLGRTFDAVFAHDAVDYLTTREDLRKAIETAWIHCRPGGAALFAPDALRETFKPGTDHGGSDGPTRAMRYLEWTWDPDPADSTYLADMVYLLRTEAGEVSVEHDRHRLGLFSRSEWLETMREAGFEAKAIPFEHSDLEPGSTEVILGIKPR